MNSKRLYRRRNDKFLMGLAGGIADYFGIDATLVRIGFIIFEFATGGLLIIGYFIVAFFVPKVPLDASATTPNK